MGRCKWQRDPHDRLKIENYCCITPCHAGCYAIAPVLSNFFCLLYSFKTHVLIAKVYSKSSSIAHRVLPGYRGQHTLGSVGVLLGQCIGASADCRWGFGGNLGFWGQNCIERSLLSSMQFFITTNSRSTFWEFRFTYTFARPSNSYCEYPNCNGLPSFGKNTAQRRYVRGKPLRCVLAEICKDESN